MRYYRFFMFLLLVYVNGKAQDSDTGYYPNNSYRQWEIADSIYIKKTLTYALRFAEVHKGEKSFEVSSAEGCRDSNKLSMEYGYLLDSISKYLLVRIPTLPDSSDFLSNTVVVEMFKLINEKFMYMQSDTFTLHSYIDDTLYDVNGDSYKDWVTMSYSGTGCCARDAENVFLFNKNSGVIDNPVSVLNPTFFPKEKIVLQMDYGWPGKVSIYKCQWKDGTLDTLESIMTAKEKNTFIVTDEHSGKITETRSLPKEYKSFEALDYFLEAWDSDKK